MLDSNHKIWGRAQAALILPALPDMFMPVFCDRKVLHGLAAPYNAQQSQVLIHWPSHGKAKLLADCTVAPQRSQGSPS